MKSLKERLEEKRLREAKEEAKLSDKVKCYRFSLPIAGYPHMSKESDVKYVKERAIALVKKIRNSSAYQLYEGLREAVEAEEKKIAESRSRRSWWEPQNLINAGISKYIVVVQNQDGTLKDEHGNVYRKDAPIQEPDPKSLVLNAVEERFRDRLADIEQRTRILSEAEAPQNVTDAQRLLDDAAEVEADLQEVLRDLEKEAPDEGIQVTITNEGGIEPLPEVQRAMEQAMNDLELTPEQQDAIIQPIGTQPLPAPENLWGEWLVVKTDEPLPEGLTFPMDLVTSTDSRTRPLPEGVVESSPGIYHSTNTGG